MVRKIIRVLTWPFRTVWNYIKPSWEGEDGKFSYKRISQLVFIGLTVHMVLSGKITTQYGFYSLIVIVTSFLLTAMIIQVPQLIALLSEIRQMKPLNPLNSITDGIETGPPNPDS